MTILEMSLGGGVLIAAILVLRRALLNRVPKWTFLLLWAAALCRLVIPFAVPSPVSVYTGAAWAVQALEREEEEAPPPVTVRPPAFIPAPLPEADWTVPVTPSPLPAPEKTEPVSPTAALYLTGAALCGLFFTAAYLWALRRFREAVPAEDPFTCRWREEHPALLPIRIKVSRAVNAPLAYGLIHPVILLPQNTDWSDRDQLTCVLTHEYVHIRRGDLLWKLLLAAALCLHWFNPLVWAMYLCANRDLELACDEAVVRILGLDSRKRYARALLAAAESGFFPLCTTYTTKNHMEERIRAVMKIKKQSLAAILAALLLVAGVTAVFATSQAPVPKNVGDLPQAVQTNPDPAPALADKSAADNRVHPVTPADTSTPEDNRVHPVTGQPSDPATDVQGANAVPADDTPSGRYYHDLPEDHLHRDALTPNPANCWGIPEGPIAEGTEIFAHNEEEYREMVRQLRRMGYDGYIGPIRYGYKVGAVLDIAYDGVQRTITPPQGILPDWTYPVNNKGETYAYLGIQGWLGYEPDLIAAVATNGQEGYMQTNYGYTGETLTPEGNKAYREWLATLPNPFQVPVYDVNRDNIVGYFEVGHQVSSEVQAKIDELTGQENRWNVPANPIPEGTGFTVSTEDELQALSNYLHDVRGIANGDLTVEYSSSKGTYTVIVAYFQTKRGEELANGYPVNSKGQTYGSALDREILGYEPDLCGVQATNGVSGYVKAHDLHYCGYQGPVKTVEEWDAFIEWQEAQPKPITIPVYDVNYDKVVGYFAFGNGNLDPALTEGKDLETVREMVKNNRVHPVTGG